MDKQFEAVGDMADWPRNQLNKPTQAAVFGMYHPKKGRCVEMLWSGKFPDLQPALYWAAKKEVEAVKKGKWVMASRVVWQHDLTPEQAVDVAAKQMGPQVDRALQALRGGRDPDIGAGPMRAVRPGEAERYVEIADADGKTLGSWIVAPDKDLDKDVQPGPKPRGTPGGFIPNDPRDD